MTRSTHRCASNERSGYDGGRGKCIGQVLGDSIFAATAAAAMVKLSSNRAVGRNRPQIYVGFVPKATYRRKCGGNAMFKSLMEAPSVPACRAMVGGSYRIDHLTSEKVLARRSMARSAVL